MSSWSKRFLVVAAFAVAGAQLVPIERKNPPVDEGKTLYALHPVPAEVHAVFDRSCRDCHSNETAWPWYSRIAPVSWIVANDVHEGRKHFNISEWGSYPGEKKLRKLGEICEQVKNEDMPDEKYTWIHWSARLDTKQRSMLCDWVETTRKPLQIEAAKPSGLSNHGTQGSAAVAQ
jgi:hypothetical protein